MEAAIRHNKSPTRAEFHQAIANRADRWFGACLRITRNQDMAEDAVQDALLSAWNKRHQFESSARLETWIHRIAVNAALQLLRKHRPERSEPLEFDVLDEAATADRLQADTEFECTLSKLLENLTEIERVCFVLRHMEQWRIREIAVKLNANEGNIRQAIFRAVKKLRSIMASPRSKNDE